MNATTERIFANDIQMMLWQEKNCCKCTKAINTSKATVYKCALQRDMDAIIAAKMGRSQSIDNPQMIALEKLMMQYFPVDFKLETNANLDLCGKIFANNLSKIEFELTNE